MSSTQTSLIEIGMPRLSDSMEEATVLRWLKQPGDHVSRGEPLVEVETDKATIVYESEAGGVLEEIVVEDGGTAALGAVIARLRPDDEQARPSTAAAQERPAPAEHAARPARRAARAAKAGRARATPIARRLATQLSVVLDGVDGTGPGGRIVAADVRAAATADGGRDSVTEIPHSPTQRTIAARMSESRSSIPEFTLEAEIDMDGAGALREELKHGGREPVPSYNDLVVRAVALALRDFPALNASYAPGKTIRHGQINIGIAVDTEEALLVPTIRGADGKSVFEIAEESRRLAERGRARALRPDELDGGTFTVSNLGMFGVRRFHAVINPPQAAILAVGDVAPRAVVDSSGAVVARKTMDVALACDHRVVYGAEAARFLQRLRHLLEHPLALVIESE
jgi:pyruvate dehydrogenase E2 component (dihydrolipoamide acetyltransferase)